MSSLQPLFVFLLLVVAATAVLAAIACLCKKVAVFCLACGPAGTVVFSPIVLAGVEPQALVVIGQPDLAQIVFGLKNSVAHWYWVPLLCLFAIYVLYILYGGQVRLKDAGKDDLYSNLIARQRSVWLVFGLLTTGVVLWLTQFYIAVDQRLTGMRATRQSTINTLVELNFKADQVVRGLDAWALRLEKPISSSTTLAKAAQQNGEIVAESVNDLTDSADSLKTLLAELRFTAADDPIVNSQGQTRTNELTLTEAFVVNQVDLAITRVLSQSVRINRLLVDTTDRTKTSSAVEDAYVDEAHMVARMQLMAVHVHDTIRDVQPIARVLTPDHSTPLSMTAILIGVFLLLPWLQYLSFVVSKRGSITRSNRRVLEDMNLLSKVILSAENTSDRREPFVRLLIDDVNRFVRTLQEVHEKDLQMACVNPVEIVNSLSVSTWVARWCETIDKNIDDARIQGLIMDLQNRIESKTALTEFLAAVGELADGLIELLLESRSFFSREYIIPLVIVTLLTAVGWFYIFFPDSQFGLIGLIVGGATIKQATVYLTRSITPFTMCFAGAWLLTTIMLTFRWLQDDLYPRAFFYASVRLIWSILMGLVFTRLFWDANAAPNDNREVLIGAFTIGVFPLEFARGLFRLGARFLKSVADTATRIGPHLPVTQAIFEGEADSFEFAPKDWSSKLPLTVLEDLTLWDDTRLYQEGVQNVNALATADLDALVLNTPFPSKQLADWVDQALLYMHAGTRWQPLLNRVGVRSATTLLAIYARGSEQCLVADVNNAQSNDYVADDPRARVLSATHDLENAISKVVAVVKNITPPLDVADWTNLKESIAADGLDKPVTDAGPQIGDVLGRLDKLTASPNVVSARTGLTKLRRQLEAIASSSQAVQSAVAAAVGTPASLLDADKCLAGLMTAASPIKQLGLDGVALTEQAAMPLLLTSTTLAAIRTSLDGNPNTWHIHAFFTKRAQAARDRAAVNAPKSAPAPCPAPAPVPAR